MAQSEIARDRRFTSPYPAADQIATFLRAVYGWMCAGLAITAVTAMFVASSPTLVTTLGSNRLFFWVLVIAQLGLVFALSARVQTLAPSTAALMFIVYSALTGVTFSFILLAFTGESIATTFLVTAGMFGALAAYGTVAKRSLQGMGQFLFMGVIGVVLASLVNIFVQSDGLQFVISFIGVIVFTGLTAYDAQRLRAMALASADGRTGSYAVVGALALYLDFINLFLMMLRFMGQRRD
jgi:FtsH-binding integral membrane protein